MRLPSLHLLAVTLACVATASTPPAPAASIPPLPAALVSIGLILPPPSAPCGDAFLIHRAAQLAVRAVNAAPWWRALLPGATLVIEPLDADDAASALSSTSAFSASTVVPCAAPCRPIARVALVAPIDGSVRTAVVLLGASLTGAAHPMPILSYVPAPPTESHGAVFSLARARADDPAALLSLLSDVGWQQFAVLVEHTSESLLFVEALRAASSPSSAHSSPTGNGAALTLAASFSLPSVLDSSSHAHSGHEHSEGRDGGLDAALDSIAEGSSRVIVLLASHQGAAHALAGARMRGMAGVKGWTWVGTGDWVRSSVWGNVTGLSGGIVGVGGPLFTHVDLARAGSSAAEFADAASSPDVGTLASAAGQSGSRMPLLCPPTSPLAAMGSSADARATFEAVWSAAAAAAAATMGVGDASGAVPAAASGGTAAALRDGRAGAGNIFALPPARSVPPQWGEDGLRVDDCGGRGGVSGPCRVLLNGMDGGGVVDLGWGGDAVRVISWGAAADLGDGAAVPPDRAQHSDVSEMRAFALQIVGVLLALTLGELLHQLGWTDVIPESAGSIIVGAILGLLIRTTALPGVVAASAFSEAFFTMGLLPIVIYESGYSLSRKPFFSLFGPITLYAIVGTCISASVTAAIIAAGVARADWGLPALSGWECITFGAFLSATDPVATLTVFGALRVESALNALVYGESVLNDAVGIVLFRAAGGFLTAPLSYTGVGSAIGSVAIILGGAVAWGVAAGALTTLALRAINYRGILPNANSLSTIVTRVVTRIKHAVLRSGRGGVGMEDDAPSSEGAHGSSGADADTFFHYVLLGSGETTLLLVFGYASFASSEAVGVSGIIAALFCGITQAIYARPLLSWPGQKVSRAVLKLIASLADCAIFLQIGMGLVLQGTPSRGEVALAAVALIGCLLGRAANVFPLSLFINAVSARTHAPSRSPLDDTPPPPSLTAALFGGHARIPLRTQVQMSWAGLRGGIAFASALNFPSQAQGAVARATVLVCVLTVAMMGPTTVPLLMRLGIKFGDAAEAAEAATSKPSSTPPPSTVVSRLDAWVRRRLYGQGTFEALQERGGGGLDAEPVLVLGGAPTAPQPAHALTPAPPMQSMTVAAALPPAPDEWGVDAPYAFRGAAL